MAVHPSNVLKLSDYCPKAPTETLRFRKDDDVNFVKACGAAGIDPGVRQYSKWCRKKGLAYETHRAMRLEQDSMRL